MVADPIVSFKKRSLRAFWLLNGLLIALACLVIANFRLLKLFYFSPHMPTIGYIVNGVVVALTLLAVAKMAVMLWKLEAEERALLAIASYLQATPASNLELSRLTVGLGRQSMIARRLSQVPPIAAQRTQDQGRASILRLGDEQEALAFFKFVNKALIFIGLLSIIMALAITSSGSSSLMESLVDLRGMGVIVQGLSVALSTTFTALLCYLIHRTLFGLLVDSKMGIIQYFEIITARRSIVR